MGWDGRSGCDGEPRWESSCRLVTEDLDRLGGVRLSPTSQSLSLSKRLLLVALAVFLALPCIYCLLNLGTYLASLLILPSWPSSAKMSRLSGQTPRRSRLSPCDCVCAALRLRTLAVPCCR